MVTKKLEKDNITFLVKNNTEFIKGACGVRSRLGGDKARAVKFEDGEVIEISQEEFEQMKQWCHIVEE